MTEQIVYLTAEGKTELEAKLEFLRTSRRREVAERIRGAKDDGDISESGEYEDAKREQAFLEGEIRSLEQTLRLLHILLFLGRNRAGRFGGGGAVIGSVRYRSPTTGAQQIDQQSQPQHTPGGPPVGQVTPL